MSRELDLEICECAGCGGEVSVVEALWLPEQKRLKPGWLTVQEKNEKPYCSQECFEMACERRARDCLQRIPSIAEVLDAAEACRVIIAECEKALAMSEEAPDGEA